MSGVVVVPDAPRPPRRGRRHKAQRFAPPRFLGRDPAEQKGGSGNRNGREAPARGPGHVARGGNA